MAEAFQGRINEFVMEKAEACNVDLRTVSYEQIGKILNRVKVAENGLRQFMVDLSRNPAPEAQQLARTAHIWIFNTFAEAVGEKDAETICSDLKSTLLAPLPAPQSAQLQAPAPQLPVVAVEPAPKSESIDDILTEYVTNFVTAMGELSALSKNLVGVSPADLKSLRTQAALARRDLCEIIIELRKDQSEKEAGAVTTRASNMIFERLRDEVGTDEAILIRDDFMLYLAQENSKPQTA